MYLVQAAVSLNSMWGELQVNHVAWIRGQPSNLQIQLLGAVSAWKQYTRHFAALLPRCAKPNYCGMNTVAF